MEQDYSVGVYAESTLEFVAVARNYCAFIEQCNTFSKKQFVDTALKISSLVYLKTLALPRFDKAYEQAVEKFVSEQDWFFVKDSVSYKLGSHEQFLDIAAPDMQESRDFTQVSLAEAFADIYQDLKNMVMTFKLGNEVLMNDSLWECQLNFENYWGPRLLASLNILHNLNYSNEELQDEAGAEPVATMSQSDLDDWASGRHSQESDNYDPLQNHRPEVDDIDELF